MKDVVITYPGRCFKWRFTKKISRQLSETWNELTPKQIERIVSVLYSDRSVHQAMQKCMRILLRVSWIRFFFLMPAMKRLWIDENGNPVTFLRLHTRFIFQTITLTKNPFPSIKPPGFWKPWGFSLYGPRDYCENMQTDEFITVETYFSDYQKSQSIEDLDLLVATLYRPAGKGPRHDPKSPQFCGEIREAFNDKTIHNHLKQVKKIPLTKKLTVLSFYRACRDIWERTYDLVFSAKGSSGGYGWFELIKAVNPSDFGTIEQKEKTPIANILLSMQIDIRDAKKAKQKFRKNGTN